MKKNDKVCPKGLLPIIQETGASCPEKKCRYYLENDEINNCSFIFIETHGKGASFREIGEVMDLTPSRVKQICDTAIRKISKIQEMKTIYQ